MYHAEKIHNKGNTDIIGKQKITRWQCFSNTSELMTKIGLCFFFRHIEPEHSCPLFTAMLSPRCEDQMHKKRLSDTQRDGNRLAVTINGTDPHESDFAHPNPLSLHSICPKTRNKHPVNKKLRVPGTLGVRFLCYFDQLRPGIGHAADFSAGFHIQFDSGVIPQHRASKGVP
jgi:hypothetical protein